MTRSGENRQISYSTCLQAISSTLSIRERVVAAPIAACCPLLWKETRKEVDEQLASEQLKSEENPEKASV